MSSRIMKELNFINSSVYFWSLILFGHHTNALYNVLCNVYFEKNNRRDIVILISSDIQ